MITITITGRVGSGKTRVTAIIEKALKTLGIKFSYVDDPHRMISDDDWETMENTPIGTPVTINEEQLSRDGLSFGKSGILFMATTDAQAVFARLHDMRQVATVTKIIDTETFVGRLVGDYEI